MRRGIDVAICHPKIVETGLDLLDFPTILFHETGYSLHTLRQSSRRSWRIGQRRPVEVKFFAYKGTMQEVCLRLMGKKLLVALAMEGKFASEGLQAIDGDDDMLTAMARELVENKGIGESADSIWRNVQQLRPSASAVADPEHDERPNEQPVMDVHALLPIRSSRFLMRALGACALSRRSTRRDTSCRAAVAILSGCQSAAQCRSVSLPQATRPLDSSPYMERKYYRNGVILWRLRQSLVT